MAIRFCIVIKKITQMHPPSNQEASSQHLFLIFMILKMGLDYVCNPDFFGCHFHFLLKLNVMQTGWKNRGKYLIFFLSGS